jgi:guanine nucleotide-binding protein alpha-1 subunit
MDDIVPIISPAPTPPPTRRGRASRNSSLSSLLETLESADSPRFSPELRQLKMRLSPLAHVEDALVRQLNPAGSVEREATELHPPREIEVNSTVWRGVFGRLLNGSSHRESTASLNAPHDPNDPAVLIHACGEDMLALWNDLEIQEFLVRKKLRLQEFAGL